MENTHIIAPYICSLILVILLLNTSDPQEPTRAHACLDLNRLVLTYMYMYMYKRSCIFYGRIMYLTLKQISLPHLALKNWNFII